MSSLPPAFTCHYVKTVGSFEELISTPFADGVNALCWPRTLPGDFTEVVRALGEVEGILNLDEERLRSLPLNEDGRAAVESMLSDLERLRSAGLDPSLDCIQAYAKEDEPGPIPLDVYSYHADSAPVQTDTYLCTYFGASSEAIGNEEAQRYLDLPEVRAALLAEYGGPDDDGFAEYVVELGYDLHYLARPGAQPLQFGVGNLWRVAVQYPGSPVPPCVHRAPEQHAGESPRLLLIS